MMIRDDELHCRLTLERVMFQGNTVVLNESSNVLEEKHVNLENPGEET